MDKIGCCLKRLRQNYNMNVNRMKVQLRYSLNGIHKSQYWYCFYQKQMKVYSRLDTDTLQYLLTEKSLDYDVNLSFSWFKTFWGAVLGTLFIEFSNWSKWINNSTVLEDFSTSENNFLIFMICFDIVIPLLGFIICYWIGFSRLKALGFYLLLFIMSIFALVLRYLISNYMTSYGIAVLFWMNIYLIFVSNADFWKMRIGMQCEILKRILAEREGLS